MRNLLKFLPFLVVGLMSHAFAQHEDMSKYQIFFNGRPISFNQIDSLNKLYPKVSFRTDKTKTPPQLFIEAFNDVDSVKLNNKLDSTSKYWTGKFLPPFNIKDIKGKLFSHASLKGKIIVLNFYFIHCAPCLQEIPMLNEIQKENKNRGVVFLAIALDKKEDLLPFLKKHIFNYNQIADGQKVTDLLKIESWPTNVVIDRKGIIRYFKQGMSEKSIKDIKTTINQLLN